MESVHENSYVFEEDASDRTGFHMLDVDNFFQLFHELLMEGVQLLDVAEENLCIFLVEQLLLITDGFEVALKKRTFFF